MNKREIVIRNCFNSWIEKDVSTFISSFANEIIYIESVGTAYRGKNQVEIWFIDWNKENKVLLWDITDFYHTECTCICEWYFKCDCGGTVYDFNGNSIINFNEANEIILLKEFQSKTPIIYPYE